MPTQAERSAAGRALRTRAPRSSHAAWDPAAKARDPIDLIEESNRGRLPELVPIRYGRMAASPFSFLRGSAALMAHDLCTTPATGLRVQACGDCHLLNFGLLATPERQLVFDLNDFDETHPGPWEWDLKRLAASFVVAAREVSLTDAQGRDAVAECMRAYRRHIAECAAMAPLAQWYERLDVAKMIENAPDASARRYRERLAKQARRRVVEQLLPKIASAEGTGYRLVDQPPVLFHPQDADFEAHVHAAMAAYRESLPHDRRVLLDRYRLVDAALKVVGIGSVGTRCYIALLVSADGDPLILQFKQALRSVLEPHTAASAYDNQGQRVVVGQRLMQASSDIFLGWIRGPRGNDFYVRQLRDMKLSIPVDGLSIAQIKRLARATGWTLARAHAKSGDAAAIAGYLGEGDNFDRALGRFASSYADQTERDHAALVKAVSAGKVEALTG